MAKKEYIERVNYCKNICLCSEDKCEKDKCPIWCVSTADVEPVRHGHWLNFYGDFQTAECSQCGECYEVSDIDKSELNGEAAKMLFEAFADSYHYCPNCGAKMDNDK